MSWTPTANRRLRRGRGGLLSGIAALLAVTLTACATRTAEQDASPPWAPAGTSVQPTAGHAEVLKSIPSDWNEAAYNLSDGTRVAVGPVYRAACGGQCRRVDLGQGQTTEHRLACSDPNADAQDLEWFFVPVVFPSQGVSRYIASPAGSRQPSSPSEEPQPSSGAAP